MKIGILSMQKILNYGSFLQAFSLKKQLEARGHDVYFIDIKNGKKLHCKPQHKMNILSKFDKFFFKRVQNFLLIRKMTRIHIEDYEVYLETGKSLSDGETFDLVVIGSDEVFNATADTGWGFSTQLFGDIDNAQRIVTYAASCGSTTIESARKFGIESEIANALENVSQVSVRDQNTLEFVYAITGKLPIMNVDPVILADYEQYIPNIKRRKPYLLVYAYENRIHNEQEIAAITAYAKKRGLQTVCVGAQQRWCSRCISANAFELLAYVKNAECIVTDTFHGTVYSIKYNKKFVTLIRDSNRNKLGGLLKQFGLYDRSVENLSEFENVFESEIDFERVNELIKEEQKKSAEYLDSICRID